MCCRHSHGDHALSAPSPHLSRRCVVPATIVALELSGSTSAYFHSKLRCRHILRAASAHRVVRCCSRTKNGKEFLLTDTVGFIQKLPTTLIAAFRATLEEISESSLLVHVVDISHPLAELQIDAVDKVLEELDTSSIPKLIVWNKVDNAKDPDKIRSEAKKNPDIVCLSALTGEGLDEFCNAVQEKLKDTMVWVEALIPFDKGELLSTIHHVGMVEKIKTSDP
ncbi:hypothetical protein SASPL_131844 [Salvia splendens]|uniref:Hflx-type G domain-containing protein n=1 Tax=Salvia splendens TaxID=180675 RepID=A0A8X8XA07_SALSN|nr:hypothetical protein SASPL_131844 [Salvia splendens]